MRTEVRVDPCLRFGLSITTGNRSESFGVVRSRPNLVGNEKTSEKTQRNEMPDHKRLATRLDWPRRLDYRTRCLLLGIPPLAERVEHARLTFIRGILNGTIDCPELHSRIYLYVPTGILRRRPMLAIAETRTTYGFRDPLLCICRLLNSTDDLYETGMTIAELTSRLSVRQ